MKEEGGEGEIRHGEVDAQQVRAVMDRKGSRKDKKHKNGENYKYFNERCETKEKVSCRIRVE